MGAPGALLAVSDPEGRGQVDSISRLTIAPAAAQNPRNSESDIVQLTDGGLLLGWTQFYEDSGADDGAARIVGRISADGGRTWDENYTLVENDGKCNVMEVNFLRLRSGHIALFHLQKDAEVSGAGLGRAHPDNGRPVGNLEPRCRQSSRPQPAGGGNLA